MRVFDSSMVGFISGNATPFSGQVGITRSLTYDPLISSVRGYIPYIDKSVVSATNILSPTELLAPFTAAGADAPRQAMQVAQTGHTLPVHKTSKQLIGSGMNKTLAFMISNDFCFKAKKSGIIQKHDKETQIVILQYDDGTRDAIDLADKLNKNSSMGFYIHQKFKLVFDEGERFQAGDVIAYNPSYFTGKGKDVDYQPGTLAKFAIASGDFAFEDSTLVSEGLGKKCTSDINILKQISLGKNANVYSIVEVGDYVQSGDELLRFMTSFDDPDTAEMLTKLAAEQGADTLEDLVVEKVEAKLSGRITDIQIFYNCEFSELSPSLQKLIKKYRDRINRRINRVEGIEESDVHILPVEKITSDKVGQQDFERDGGVIINIWTEYESPMGKGDKLTFSTALKGVISKVLKEDETPLSEYRPEDPVEAILAATGYISRMCGDIYLMCGGNKVLVELGKQIREIWNDKR